MTKPSLTSYSRWTDENVSCNIWKTTAVFILATVIKHINSNGSPAAAAAKSLQ